MMKLKVSDYVRVSSPLLKEHGEVYRIADMRGVVDMILLCDNRETPPRYFRFPKEYLERTEPVADQKVKARNTHK